MPGTGPGSAREEAERLVATVLAAARLATAGRDQRWSAGLGGIGEMFSGGFATGTAECRVCPLCRAITALRDPSPEFAERLATGAGEVAAGVAHLLRALAEATGPAGPTPRGPAADGGPAGSTARTGGTASEPTGGTASDDQVWREATRTGHDSWPTPAPAHGPDLAAGERPVVPASRAPEVPVAADDDVPGDGD